MHKQGDSSERTNQRDISLFSLTVKVYAKYFEKRFCETIELKKSETQCGFRAGRSNRNIIFIRQQSFDKSCKYEDVYTCFVDMEKAYDRFPRNKSFRECCGSTMLPATCYWASSHLLLLRSFCSFRRS